MKKDLQFLLADDHAVVRKGLVQIIKDEFAESSITEVADGHAVLSELKIRQFDLMVCDLTMPGLNGLDLCKRVREVEPQLPVLILSMHGEEVYAIRALRAGANGYLTKESAPEEMILAIHQILSGRKYVSSSLAVLMAEHFGGLSQSALHENLSDRELEVLKHIVNGKSLNSIGALFDLSPNTISTYRSRIMEKLKMKSNADLISYAIEHKLK